jgi:YbgC/YbaW family acyl-CoA thioester hydrolase
MEGFRFTLPYSARIGDINYGGHVSNAAVFHYFQDARIAYLARLGPYSEGDVGDGLGLIVLEARARYRAEMFLGNALEIGVRIESLGRTSLTMGFRVERGGELTVEGTTALAAFDYRARQPRRVPQPFREAVSAFEGIALEA